VNVAVTIDEIERFRNAVSQRIGLHFDDAKLDYLRAVFQRRVEKCGRGSTAYLWELEYELPDSEISALARELTVGETYFFRNHEQFEALAEIALPERLRTPGRQRALRLLSAGCSSGEEAYSMAIVARETIADPSCKVFISAVDLNPAALEKARRARYSAWALRETRQDIQSKWFAADGREMVLDESIRATVEFAKANLASDDPALWQPSAYDAIFCRNVLMYFAPKQMRAAVARIARSLAPGGYLFLGHAETLRGVSEEFDLRSSHNTFYYQLKRGGHASGAEIIRLPEREATYIASAPTPATEPNGAWFDTIRAASERVAALLPAPQAERQSAQQSRQPFDPAPTLKLLREERFAEALNHFRDQSGAVKLNAEMLLLETALLLHSGQIAAAEAAAAGLLLLDRGNAGAHYLLALCREHAGDHGRAVEHHRTAATLDPSFAMPRLHLGLLARRRGDRETARRELAQARVLLAAEDNARILLFGGGFSRESLAALCEGALKDCRGRP
jgi:chemotaxis protein methyltransferase CheR